jgi:hypothetical protein
VNSSILLEEMYKRIQAIIHGDFKKTVQGLKFLVLIPFEKKKKKRENVGFFFCNNASSGAWVCQ